MPKDFKPTDSFTWTIVANGQSTSIPLRLNPDYVMSPFTEIAVGNTPPAIRFEPNGKTIQGPLATPRRARRSRRPPCRHAAARCTLWATDDMKYTSGTNAPLGSKRAAGDVSWSKYRGPGAVTFDKPRPSWRSSAGRGRRRRSTARRSRRSSSTEPGDYVLHVTANDYSGDGGGGFGCCWTTALVKVSVK